MNLKRHLRPQEKYRSLNIQPATLNKLKDYPDTERTAILNKAVICNNKTLEI